jgi:HmuY protein
MARLWFLLVLSGCFESIAPDAGVAADATTVGKYSTTRNADGSYTTVIDATSAADWVYGDFDTGLETSMTGPWDLRFQRFHISTNGGVSGSGGVEVVPIAEVPFVQVTAAPASGWTSDSGDDANGAPSYAFEQGNGWYDYDPTTHVLTPKRLVWVVRTHGGATIKLEITNYYDDAGTAGWFTLRWSQL